MDVVRKARIASREIHEVMAAEDTFAVVTEHGGIAFVSQATASKPHSGVIFKPHADESLRFETCVVTQAQETSRLVDQIAKALVIRLSHLAEPEQMPLGEAA